MINKNVSQIVRLIWWSFLSVDMFLELSKQEYMNQMAQ